MDLPTHSYRIRLARADEVLRLRAIEDEAGTLFAGLGLVDEALDPSFPSDAAAKLVALRQVWVACLEDDLPVGMVIASERDGVAYVEELDVVPAHGRRGLGARLLEQACAWAAARGYAAITLSTFRELPWNGPFYRKHGFRDLEPAEWSPGMAAIRESEARHGLRVDARVFMRRELPSRAGARGGWSSGMRRHLRIARPVSDLSRSMAMYCAGLGLHVLGSFEDHEGFDGVMLGTAGASHHLELTSSRSRPVRPRPTEEDLLVFYVPDDDEWDRCCGAMRAAGFRQVSSFNPYWDRHGCTFQDPDGYRVVLQRERWTSWRGGPLVRAVTGREVGVSNVAAELWPARPRLSVLEDRSMRITGVCGSLAAGSSNRLLLHAAAAGAPEGVEVVVFEGLRELPHFDPDVEAAGPPTSVRVWRRTLADSDAVLIASPEYGHSLPGVLKNAIDWVIGSGELYRKVVGITAAVPHASRGLRGLEALARTLGAVDATLAWNAPIVHEHGLFGAELGAVLRALVGEVRTRCEARGP